MPIGERHMVRVQQRDGSVQVECDHTFKGTRHCVHCGKAFEELQREFRADLERLQVEAARQQIDEDDRRGSLPNDDIAIPVTLGPSLRPRVEALAATGRLGRELEHVVQTLFVLGMLDAEGQDPQAHVGDPMLHVSHGALFVRFGLPHEGGAEATRQRAGILRQLLLDLSEWCDEDDPLRPAFAAAIAALPRAALASR